MLKEFVIFYICFCVKFCIYFTLDLMFIFLAAISLCLFDLPIALLRFVEILHDEAMTFQTSLFPKDPRVIRTTNKQSTTSTSAHKIYLRSAFAIIRSLRHFGLIYCSHPTKKLTRKQNNMIQIQ